MTCYLDISLVSSSFLGGRPAWASCPCRCFILRRVVVCPVLVGGIPPGPPSIAGSPYGGSHLSHQLDLKGTEVVAPFPSSLWVGASCYGGASSTLSYGYGCRYKHWFNSVSPLHHGESPVSFARAAVCHGGLPSSSPVCPSVGDIPRQYGGTPYPPGGVPPFLYDAHGGLNPRDGISQVVFGAHCSPLHGFHHGPTSVRTL